MTTKLGRARLAISIIFAINGFIYANWTSRLPRLQEIYSIDKQQLGFMLLAISIGALVAMPLTGYFIVKTGSRRLTTTTLLFFVLTTPLLAYVPNYLAFTAIGILIGMATGALDIAMNAQAILVEEGMKKPIMSSFHAIFSMGMLLGAGTASLFIWLGADVHIHFPVVCLIAFVFALWSVQQLIPDQETATKAVAGEVEKKGFQFHPTIMVLGLAAFCCMMGEGAMADWTPIYMITVAGSPELWAPLGQAAFSGSMMLGRFAGDSARATYGSRSLIRGGGILALTGLSIALFFPTPILAFIGFLLVGLGLSNIVPIAYSISGSIPGIPTGVGISSVTTIGYSGFLFGPPIIGFLSERYDQLVAQGIQPWTPLPFSWQGLQWGLGFIWILFVLLVVIGFFFLNNEEKSNGPS